MERYYEFFLQVFSCLKFEISELVGQSFVFYIMFIYLKFVVHLKMVNFELYRWFIWERGF